MPLPPPHVSDGGNVEVEMHVHRPDEERGTPSRFQVHTVEEDNVHARTHACTVTSSSDEDEVSGVDDDDDSHEFAGSSEVTCEGKRQQHGSPTGCAEQVSTGGSMSTTYHSKGLGTFERVPASVYYRGGDDQSQIHARANFAVLVGEESPFMEGSMDQSLVHLEEADNAKEPSESDLVKFGWVKGVLIRCLLNIWGVMLFIRLSWIVGNAGIGLSLVIIAVATMVTTITTLSMSAIGTNGTVKGGGAYHMIARHLGPEFGGAIGLIFSFANAVAVSIYVVGFAETMVSLYAPDTFTGSELWDTRIIGCCTTAFVGGIALIGMGWESKVQIILLFTLLFAIGAYVIGTFLPSESDWRQDAVNRGFSGYRSDVAALNFKPGFVDENFISIFSVFFPAATGILAGANISGDLKDAQKAIPKGTLLAITITSCTYSVLAIIVGACTWRNLNDAIDNDSIPEDFLDFATEESLMAFAKNTTIPPNISNEDLLMLQDFGLLHSYNIMQVTSIFGPIVICGIFAATLSSALASFVGAPRVFQAVCKDNIYPNIGYFAKGKGSNNDPVRGYGLVFVVSICFTLIGELNEIAKILSILFLMAYMLINMACFTTSFSNSPGWRPSFKYYNKWLALVGSFMCLTIMFIIEWWMAILAFGLTAILYKWVDYKKPEANWGTSTEVYKFALHWTQKLKLVQEHIKTWRPQYLVMSGALHEREDLVRFMDYLGGSMSLLLCVEVTLATDFNKETHAIRQKRVNTANQFLKRHKLDGVFYKHVTAATLRAGAQTMMQAAGVGNMRPNVFVVGFKEQWMTSTAEDCMGYCQMVFDAFRMKMGVGIVRNGLAEQKVTQGPVSKLNEIKFCRSKPAKGIIDVWWLIDDGGLTILLPHLLQLKSNNSNLSNCSIRILNPTTVNDLQKEQLRMVSLMKKFRINAEVVTIPGMAEMPSEPSIRAYCNLRKDDAANTVITYEELCKVRASRLKGKHRGNPTVLKTLQWIRKSELFLQYSSGAELVVISLVIPKKSEIEDDPKRWLHTLDCITKNLPPCFLLRGNQNNVLTFDS